MLHPYYFLCGLSVLLGVFFFLLDLMLKPFLTELRQIREILESRRGD
jgi:hypothetical protein